MKRIRIVGLCLVAVCALFALTATSAFAATHHQPEFGHCVKKAGGKYATAACTTEVAGKTLFEWVPGLEKPVTLTSKIKELTSATLETVGGTKITCKNEEGSGQIDAGNPATHVSKVKALFKECTTSGVPCTSAGKGSGEIETFNLAGGIGIEKIGLKEGVEEPIKDTVAEELGPESGTNDAEFTCAGIPVEVRGTVLHKITSNKMIIKATEKFSASKGEQKPDKYAKGVVDEHTLESNNNKGPFEEAGQTITAIVTLSEKVETNVLTGPVCGAFPCHS